MLPPFRFTDESIIPVMVHVEGEHNGCVDETELPSSRRHVNIFSQLLHRLVHFSNTIGTSKTDADCVSAFMPRREYLKYFALDEQGNYIGSEVQHPWSEEELLETFGKYRYAQTGRWMLREEEGGFVFKEESEGYEDEGKEWERGSGD
ncbi:hypothetical protein LTR66_004829 [Elasticomyces elasticus]|nr:hypothetical protein LTR50_004944 [Elasticomyces elasticus]KAK4995336.1 hypothetical protein LTR66_004829 [Elasticomyces elasticus]